MNKAKTVVDFYVLCNELKNVIRSGWKLWNVRRDRLESVAEHIFGVQMLAIAMHSQYNYDIDIYKVIMMLAVHELEEIIIGDLTPWDMSAAERNKQGKEAVRVILQGMLNKEEIKMLILEFDARKTKEAKFAFYCDKLEADIQAKLYDAEGCVDLGNQDGNRALRNERVQELLQAKKSWSGMWLTFDREKYGFDENFAEVSKYVENNDIAAARKNGTLNKQRS